MAVGLLSVPMIGPYEVMGRKGFGECCAVTVGYIIVIVRILFRCNKPT